MLIVLACALCAVFAASATSTLNLGVQVAEIGPDFQIRYVGGTGGGFVGSEGAVVPSDETVSITDGYADRAYAIYHIGNLSASKAVAVSLCATSFLNQADSDLPSLAVSLLDCSLGFDTSDKTTPASISLAELNLPVGNTTEYTKVEKSEFFISWLGSNSLPAGNYRSTITVSYTVV